MLRMFLECLIIDNFTCELSFYPPFHAFSPKTAQFAPFFPTIRTFLSTTRFQCQPSWQTQAPILSQPASYFLTSIYSSLDTPTSICLCCRRTRAPQLTFLSIFGSPQDRPSFWPISATLSTHQSANSSTLSRIRSFSRKDPD